MDIYNQTEFTVIMELWVYVLNNTHNLHNKKFTSLNSASFDVEGTD